jgi:antitoxin CptB
METDANRRKRLLYQAEHRGFKEADLLLGGFAKTYLQGLTSAELDAFERLLAFPDREIYAWIVDGVEAPAEVKGALFERICALAHRRG